MEESKPRDLEEGDQERLVLQFLIETGNDLLKFCLLIRLNLCELDAE